MGAAEFFAGVGGFFSTALGSFIVGAALAVPTSCEVLIDGEWLECDGTSRGSCPIDTSPDLTQVGILYTFRCANIFGLDTFVNRQANAASSPLASRWCAHSSPTNSGNARFADARVGQASSARDAVEASGVARPARIYDLRSTFASNALAAGVTVFELAKVMGTSVGMAERRYGTLLGGAHLGIVGRLDALDAQAEAL